MTFKILSTVTVKRDDSDGWDSSVSIVTTVWTVLYSNPGGRKGLSFIKNLQFGSEAHTAPPPPLNGYRVSFVGGYEVQGVTLTLPPSNSEVKNKWI